jgi:hypothetical protein
VEGAAGLRIGGARSSWARGAGGQRVSCFTGLLRMTRSVFGAGGSETAGSGRGVTRGSTRRITGLACRASSGARRERSRCSKLSTRGVRSLVRKVSQLSRSGGAQARGSGIEVRSGWSSLRAAALALCGAPVSMSFGVSGRARLSREVPRVLWNSNTLRLSEPAVLRIPGPRAPEASEPSGAGALRGNWSEWWRGGWSVWSGV